MNATLSWFDAIISWDDPLRTVAVAVVIALFIYM